MTSGASRLIRKAVEFRGTDGSATVDWVTLTSVIVVTGIVTVYFILGENGGVIGVVDAMNAEVNEAAEAISGVAGQGAPDLPGDGSEQQAGGG